MRNIDHSPLNIDHSPLAIDHWLRRCWLQLALFTVTCSLFTSPAQAQTIGDAFYVYTKDGNISTFLRSEVTEFYYGFEDEEGVTHDDPVMQLIVMGDSVNKILLSDIDSVSFVTPATVYQPGVIRIEDGLMDFVESSDSLTIQFAANTQPSILPKVGDRLVTLEMNEKFPYGFVGEVKSVSGTTVECSKVSLTDVFDTYYNVSGNFSTPVEESRRIPLEYDWDYDKYIILDPIVRNFTPEMEDIIEEGDFTLSGQAKLKLTITPKIHVKATVIVSPKRGMKMNATLTGDFNTLAELGVYGKMKWTPEWRSKDIRLARIPIPYVPLFFVYLNPGAYANMSGELTADMQDQFDLQVQATMERDLLKLVQKKPTLNFRVSNHKFTPGNLSLKGSFELGGYVELGINCVSSDIAKFCVRAQAGPEVSSSLALHSSDVINAKTSPELYNRLSDVRVDLKFCHDIGLEYGVDEDIAEDAEGTLVTFSDDKKLISSWRIVPEFKNLSFEQSYSPRTSANAHATVVADPGCLIPVETGLRVTNADNETVKEWLYPAKFGGIEGLKAKKQQAQVDCQIDNLDTEAAYKVTPTVKLMGIEMLATPSADLERDPFPVRIVSIEQTGSHYSRKQGYEYDGKNYFYKFNVTTTVELNSEAKGIKDWGYIYHDIYDEDKKISCANLGTLTYPDTRYAYYYNGPQRTVDLRPYVQYEGENEIVEGKRRITYYVEFTHDAEATCPDDNHPHMIDLGLPSGTLWACCNVGAEDPKEEGSMFYGGSTSPFPEHWRTTEVYRNSFYSYENGTDKKFGYNYGWPRSGVVYSWMTDIKEEWMTLKDVSEIADFNDYIVFEPEIQAIRNDTSVTYYDFAGTKYDAATKYWGEGWQTPGYMQLDELTKQCTLEPVFDGVRSNPICFKFTGPNGRSILLPAFCGRVDENQYTRVRPNYPSLTGNSFSEEAYDHFGYYMVSYMAPKYFSATYKLRLYYSYSHWLKFAEEGWSPVYEETGYSFSIADQTTAVRPVAAKKVVESDED